MTTGSRDTPPTTAIDSLADYDRLRDDSTVSFHDETDVVDSETFEAVSALENTAVVGVTNGAGDVLLMRVTDTCELKLPTPSVAAGEDYATTAREWIRTQAGLETTLDSVEEVWCYEVRLAETDRVASRAFVVFGASPVADGDEVSAGAPPEAHAVDWFDTLPDDAVEAPGTQLFFD